MRRKRPDIDEPAVLSEAARLAAAADPLARGEACRLLRGLRELSQEAVCILQTLLRDPEAKVRMGAALTAGVGWGKGRELVPVLIQDLEDDDPCVRAACSMLSRMSCGPIRSRSTSSSVCGEIPIPTCEVVRFVIFKDITRPRPRPSTS